MKRLFEVTVEKTMYVLAEDSDEAELEAKTYESEEDAQVLSAREITSADQIPQDCLDTLPWGNDEGPELTLAQIMEQPAPPAPYVDPPEQGRLDFPGGAQPA